MNPEYMQQAIKKGWEGVEKEQEPFGACVVKDGKIVSLCHNTVWSSVDVSAHAEMNAIREACQELDTTDLLDCEIYATFKPCPMCQYACQRTNISRIYYGVAREDVGASPRKFSTEITAGFLKDKCLELVKGWHALADALSEFRRDQKLPP